MSECRSCGAEIVWAQTEYGKRIPLDAAPYQGDDPRGLFVLRSGTAMAVPPDAFPDEPNYRTHFVTCPDRDAWRQPKGAA